MWGMHNINNYFYKLLVVNLHSTTELHYKFPIFGSRRSGIYFQLSNVK